MNLLCRVAVMLWLLSLGQVVMADTAATNALSPNIQQQLLDAEKRVLSAQEALMVAREQWVIEKTAIQKAEHQLFTENSNTLSTYITLGIIAGVLLGWVSMAMTLYFKIGQWFDAKIKRNSHHLGKIADASRLENRIKQEAKILVLVGDAGDSGLRGALRNFGFESVTLKACPANASEINLSDYTQIVFDNIDERRLRDFVESGHASWYLAYLERGQYDRDFVNNNKITFANTKITVYPRLMELLVWKKQQGNA